MEKRRTLTRFSDACGRLVLWAAGLVFLFLSVVGLYSTCYIFIDFATNNHERVQFHGDSILLNLLALAVWLALFLLLSRKKPTQSLLRAASAAAVLLPAAVGLWWIFAAKALPGADSRSIINAANALMAGNPLPGGGAYFRVFPFQLGYLAFAEGFFRLFGANNLLGLACLNVLCLAISNLAVLGITKELFDNERVRLFTALLLALCLQPAFLCTFLYGNLPGLALSLLGVRCVIAYLKGGKALVLLPGALLFALSVTVKMNFMLPLIAGVVALFLFALRKKKVLPALLASTLLLCALLLPKGVQRFYERRLDTEFGEGTPQMAWFAAGLNESSICSGWFNSYTTTVLSDNDYDQARTKAAIRENYTARIELFLSRPRYLAAFFYKKIVSQWNEPAFQSLWSSAAGEHSGQLSPFVEDLCFGRGEKVINGFFNVYVELLYVSFVAGMWALRRDGGREERFLFPLTLLGAFVYHALFEAKAQYVLVYLPMLIPYAACGLVSVCDKISGAFETRKE